jgi:hypothetical protein
MLGRDLLGRELLGGDGWSLPPVEPVTGPAVFTYFAFDAMSMTLLAELPLTGVTFGNRFNGSGTFSGQIPLSDPAVQALHPFAASRPGRTYLAIDLNGRIVWGGLIETRTYQKAATPLVVPLGGTETWGYLGSQLQAADYTYSPIGGPYWNDPFALAGGNRIAARVAYDVLQNPYVMMSGMAISVTGTVPSEDQINASFPISQRQTIDAIISNMASAGYDIGFDYCVDVAWSDGPGSTPVGTLNIDYPRRGKIGPASQVVIDLDACIDYTWPEDASGQALTIFGTASSSGGLQHTYGPDVVALDAGWPLTGVVESYSAVNTQDALDGAVLGDAARLEYPVITATVTLPVIGTGGNPGLTDVRAGDDVRVVAVTDPRWIEAGGLDTYLRIIAVDVTVPNEGVVSYVLTLSLPPAVAPISPPPS